MESPTRGFPTKSTGSMDMIEDPVSHKVLQYEKFLNETLRGDLKKILDERDKVYAELAEFLQLKTVIERIQETKLDGKPLKTQVDLGCNVYIQAKVHDSSRIFVCVGFGFYVEFTLPEALKFIDKKVKYLTAISDGLTKDAARIKAHVKLTLEALREVQGIDSKPTNQPQRDLFT